MNHFRSALLAAATTAQLLAQGPPAELVGITAMGPDFMKRNQQACTQTLCNPAGFPMMTGLPYFGGTGWDPTRSGAWISNGPTLALIDANCTYLCPPMTSPTPGAITGLEVVESLNQLWATDANSNLIRMTLTCPPTVVGGCNLGITPSPTRGTSGLAVDEGRGLVFVSAGDWSTGSSQLRVSLIGAPCAPFHIQPLFNNCSAIGMRIVTGLAVDWGNRTLFFTDGYQTIGWTYTYNPAGPSISFAPLNCCTVAGTDTLIGLAVRPRPPQPFGAPCANGSCPSCPMVHSLVGDPNLGNGSFALSLAGVPSGSIAYAMLSLGNCSSAGTTIAGLCGPIWLGPLWGQLGPNFPTGLGCVNTTFPLPLPASVAFANLPVASQCVALCPSTGTTLSNCLSWTMQGN
jgi:hypothetical protein